jgi:hypothetical protein
MSRVLSAALAISLMAGPRTARHPSPTSGPPQTQTQTSTLALTPTLGVSGDAFTVDRQKRFLLFVSYFDALDASDDVLDEDFRTFTTHGIDGIRLFANWWDCSTMDACTQPSPRTLMDAAGALRPPQVERLRRVLARAASQRLLVDLTFTRETVRDGDQRLDVAGYERGILAVTRELRDKAPHVLFDLQNEVEIHGFGPSPEIAGNLVRQRAEIKQLDPSRLVVASTGSVDLVRQLGARGGLDAIAFHDPRVAGWWTRTGTVVSDLKKLSASPRPVYLQEPTAYQQAGARSGRDDTNVDHFRAALRDARAAGAAAWLFHTRKGFRLDDRSFTSQQEAGEREFLRAH